MPAPRNLSPLLFLAALAGCNTPASDQPIDYGSTGDTKVTKNDANADGALVGVTDKPATPTGGAVNVPVLSEEDLTNIYGYGMTRPKELFKMGGKVEGAPEYCASPEAFFKHVEAEINEPGGACSAEYRSYKEAFPRLEIMCDVKQVGGDTPGEGEEDNAKCWLRYFAVMWSEKDLNAFRRHQVLGFGHAFQNCKGQTAETSTDAYQLIGSSWKNSSPLMEFIKACEGTGGDTAKGSE